MKNKLVVIINGRGTSGKDTCISFINSFKVMNVSSIDPIKEAATILGWNGVKTKKARKYLSDMKKLSVEFNDYPMNYIMKMYEKFMSLYNEDDVMCIHVREPEEIKKIKDNIPRAFTLLVKRDLVGELGNDSDDNVEDFEYDVEFENNGTMEEANVNFNKLINYLYKASATYPETNL